ncbi:MAG: cell division protein ZapA [Oscillospiraceae bacterium]|nr:cell division protein ZapA [Oscillospiraceae bacterium]
MTKVTKMTAFISRGWIASFEQVRYNVTEPHSRRQIRPRIGAGKVVANRVVITLGGVRYPLRTVEDPAYVGALAEEIDDKLRKVMGDGNLSLSEALVVMCLEYYDANKKAERDLDNMRLQVADYMEAVKKSEAGLSKAKEEVARLKKKKDS